MKVQSSAALIILAVTFATASAQATDSWRFCTGASFLTHQAYLTDIFESTEKRDVLERWLTETLASQGVRAFFVRCPLAQPSKIDAGSAHDQAEHFLDQFGFAVTHVGVC